MMSARTPSAIGTPSLTAPTGGGLALIKGANISMLARSSWIVCGAGAPRIMSKSGSKLRNGASPNSLFQLAGLTHGLSPE